MSDIDEPWTEIGYKTIGERMTEKDTDIKRLKSLIIELVEEVESLSAKVKGYSPDRNLLQRALEITNRTNTG